ncbi:MAG: SdrD B-like domain-containing protein [Chloroflexota bacterium]
MNNNRFQRSSTHGESTTHVVNKLGYQYRLLPALLITMILLSVTTLAAPPLDASPSIGRTTSGIAHDAPAIGASASASAFSVADEADIFAQIRADQQTFRWDEAVGAWQAPHIGQGYATTIEADGSMMMQPNDKPWTWGLRLHSLGYGDQMQHFHGQTPTVTRAATELVQKWSPTVEEWFRNNGDALEHGFTLHERPDGGQYSVFGHQYSVFGNQYSVAGLPTYWPTDLPTYRPPTTDLLKLKLDLLTEFTPVIEGDTIRFVDAAGETQLRYAKLFVYDADGKSVPSHFALGTQAGRDQIEIAVDDSQARYPLTIDPSIWLELQKILSSDGAASDRFGSSMALSGDTLLIGAYRDDDNGSNSGSAYVFVRSGNTWSEQQKLLPSDGAANDQFGENVALDGDTALIGAYQDDDNGSNSGSAYVFTRSGNTWSQQQKLLPSDGAADDWFGYSLALDGDTLLIGAYEDDDNGTDSGSAYVFTRSGSTWSEQQKLLSSDGAADDRFSSSVALDGDTLLIGAYRDEDNGTNSGAAYVFTRSGSTWSEQQKLLPSDGDATDRFGENVALHGDTALIGVWRDDDNGTSSGAAYVFTRSGSTWSEQQKLLPSDGDTGDIFGERVALSGDTALIGAHEDDDNGSDSGAAYVFRRSGNTWSEESKLLAPDGVDDDFFGSSVVLEGDTALIGALYDDDNGLNSGSVYFFQSLTGIIVGAVFEDANDNGVRDGGEAGFANVTVTALDSSGTVTSTVTDDRGIYLLHVNTAGLSGRTRLEFSLPLDGSLDHLQPAAHGSNNGTTVQFVEADSEGVVIAHAGYAPRNGSNICVNPTIATACLVPGSGASSGDSSAGFLTAAYPDGLRSETSTAQVQELGAVWGSAFDIFSGRLYNAALLKRHVGLGPLAPFNGSNTYTVDGVYQIDYVAGVGSFDSANPGFTLHGVNGIDLGTVQRTLDTNGTLDDDYELRSDQSVDLAAFDAVGKVGFGNIDINSDDRSLWLVNLNEKTLIRVDTQDGGNPLPTDGSTAPAAIVSTFPISDPGCGGNHRPWALTFSSVSGSMVGYVGVVCEDASNAYVRSFDPASPATQTTEMTIPLGYAREEVFHSDIGTVPDAAWQPWTSVWQSVPVQSGKKFLGGEPAAYPQPILSDIEFSGDGDMTVGLMDRWGHQMRNLNLEAKPLGQLPQPIRSAAPGDLIHVCNVGGNWVLEGDAGCTDSVDKGGVTSVIAGGANASDQKEFYKDEENATCTYHTFFWETFTGGSCMVGSNQLVATVFGAPNEGFVKNGDIWNQGLRTYNTDNGSLILAEPIDDELSCFADTGNSLGEPSCLCDPPPTEVGNLVWRDDNGDGVQSPCEPGISGVTVELVDSSNTVIASAITDLRGEYYFSSGFGPDRANAKYNLMIPGSGVSVRIANAIGGSQQAPLSGLVLSPADQVGANAVVADQVDADASLNGNDAEIAVDSTGGRVDHTYDFGFTTPTQDLALRKTTSVQYVAAGSSVTFQIEVFNQGGATVGTFDLTDYIPANLTLNDANWTSGVGIATRTINAGDELPGCGLAPGDSVIVEITFDIAGGLPDNTVITNEVEISAMSTTDSDSTPDAIQGNESGTVDDIIDNTGGDEDDADIATITVTSQPVYDLALRKTLALGQSDVVNEGDDVTFTIEVFNQGTVAATTVTLIDTYPTGFSLSANDGNGWVDGGSSATVNLPSTLAAGSSTTINIVLTAGSTLGLATNTTEISVDDGADGDSTPNGGSNNLINDVINDDGTNDEDDHDVESVTVRRFDLALTKVLATGEPITSVVGADVNFVIEVTNEGSVDAYDIIVGDTPPAGLELSENSSGGWAENSVANDGMLYSVIPGPLAPGDSQQLTITLRVSNTASLGVLTNHAEIVKGTDTPGEASVTDLDSTPGNGSTTEDDDDTATITIGTFDLALTKTFVSDTSPDDNTDATLGAGERITFRMTVTNQGDVDAYDVRITDNNPAGIILDDSDPALNYDNGWRVENMTRNHVVLPGPIAANGGTAMIDIVLVAIGPDSLLYPAGGILGTQTNYAEISSASNKAGGPSVTDTDSIYEEDATDDAGGQPGSAADDYIDGDGTGTAGDGVAATDADDHDPEQFTIVSTYDLALRKYSQVAYTSGYTLPLLQPGQSVVYEYEIVNQGLAAVEDIIVIDYVPAGFTLSDANWTPNTVAGPGTATRTHTGVNLAPGASMTATVTLVADTNIQNEVIYTNTMEIADMLVSSVSVIDSDSTPDTNRDNDIVVIDNMLRGNAKLAPTTQDEDDHDIALMMGAFVSLGNRVWNDANDDGLLNNGESGIAEVELQLLNGDGSDYDNDAVTAGTQVYTVTTDASGYYTFTALPDGVYRVRVTAANFTTGNPLEGATSSTDVANTSLPDGNADDDDNGPGVASALVESEAVTLTLGLEPTGELHLGAIDASNDTNYTVDFGFYRGLASVAVEKIRNTPDPVFPGTTVTFTIRITNTGTVPITSLPLTDTYDTTYLTYVGLRTTPTSDSTANSGQIVWSDLTQTAPNGFGQDFGPGDVWDVMVEFVARLDTTPLPNGWTVNTAQVFTETDTDTVRIYNPTSVLLSNREVTAEADGIVLSWSTVDETELVGFHVMVIDEQSGDYIPLTSDAEMILAEQAGQSAGADYAYTVNAEDAEMDADTHYVLALVMADGTQRFVNMGMHGEEVWEVYLPVLWK